MASCVKEGLFYVGEDPQLGTIRGLDPWAVDNGIHLIRAEKDAAAFFGPFRNEAPDAWAPPGWARWSPPPHSESVIFS